MMMSKVAFREGSSKQGLEIGGAVNTGRQVDQKLAKSCLQGSPCSGGLELSGQDGSLENVKIKSNTIKSSYGKNIDLATILNRGACPSPYR